MNHSLTHQPQVNLIRITLGCFLSYAILSGMLSQIGTLSSAMSDFFDRPVTETSAQFTWLSAGITTGSVVSLFVYEVLSLKKAFLFSYVFLIAMLGWINVIEQWHLLPAGLLLAGLAASLGLNTAAVTLSVLYEGRRRAAMLLCTDVCFAGAGIIAAPGAAMLLAAGFGWASSYGVIALVAGMVLLIVMASRYPPTAREIATPMSADRWHPALFLCGAALAIYLFGQIVMLIWLPNYLEVELQADRTAGATAISRYWTGMALGQILLVMALIRFDIRNLLALICVASVLVSVLLWTLNDATLLTVAALLLGLCNAGILKLTMAFGASLVNHPQRVITALLFCASLGQVVSPMVSAQLVEQTSMQTALGLVSISYLAAAIFLLAALISTRHRFQQKEKGHVA